MFCITASRISVLADALRLPECVDRAPFRGAGKHLMRMVGACKEGTNSYLPIQGLPRHPLHEHILTFLTGEEVDVSDLYPDPDQPTVLRPRLTATSIHEQQATRKYVTAPWLQQQEEHDLSVSANRCLGNLGMHNGYHLGRLQGCRMYASTHRTTGRDCQKGRHHDSNRFYVEFQRSGDIMFSCFGSGCCGEPPFCIGKWQTSLEEMLASPALFVPR